MRARTGVPTVGKRGKARGIEIVGLSFVWAEAGGVVMRTEPRIEA